MVNRTTKNKIDTKQDLEQYHKMMRKQLNQRYKIVEHIHDFEKIIYKKCFLFGIIKIEHEVLVCKKCDEVIDSRIGLLSYY